MLADTFADLFLIFDDLLIYRNCRSPREYSRRLFQFSSNATLHLIPKILILRFATWFAMQNVHADVSPWSAIPNSYAFTLVVKIIVVYCTYASPETYPANLPVFDRL